jgi:hypothetical protein
VLVVNARRSWTNSPVVSDADRMAGETVARFSRDGVWIWVPPYGPHNTGVDRDAATTGATGAAEENMTKTKKNAKQTKPAATPTAAEKRAEVAAENAAQASIAPSLARSALSAPKSTTEPVTGAAGIGGRRAARKKVPGHTYLTKPVAAAPPPTPAAFTNPCAVCGRTATRTVQTQKWTGSLCAKCDAPSVPAGEAKRAAERNANRKELAALIPGPAEKKKPLRVAVGPAVQAKIAARAAAAASAPTTAKAPKPSVKPSAAKPAKAGASGPFAHDPRVLALYPVGATIEKVYRPLGGSPRTVKVRVDKDGFTCDGAHYETLHEVGNAVRGKKATDGLWFFGVVNPKKKVK